MSVATSRTSDISTSRRAYTKQRGATANTTETPAPHGGSFGECLPFIKSFSPRIRMGLQVVHGVRQAVETPPRRRPLLFEGRLDVLLHKKRHGQPQPDVKRHHHDPHGQAPAIPPQVLEGQAGRIARKPLQDEGERNRQERQRQRNSHPPVVSHMFRWRENFMGRPRPLFRGPSTKVTSKMVLIRFISASISLEGGGLFIGSEATSRTTLGGGRSPAIIQTHFRDLLRGHGQPHKAQSP